jgi:hypothetical protein
MFNKVIPQRPVGSLIANLNIVGRTVKDAHEVCAKQGYRMRVRWEDGTGLVGTCDFCRDRVNVSVTKGIVTGIVGMG